LNIEEGQHYLPSKRLQVKMSAANGCEEKEVVS